MDQRPIPRQRPAHRDELSFEPDVIERELQALLVGEDLARHGRRCACAATCSAVTR